MRRKSTPPERAHPAYCARQRFPGGCARAFNAAFAGRNSQARGGRYRRVRGDRGPRRGEPDRPNVWFVRQRRHQRSRGVRRKHEERQRTEVHHELHARPLRRRDFEPVGRRRVRRGQRIVVVVAAVVRPHLRRRVQVEDRVVRVVPIVFPGRFVRPVFVLIVPVGRPFVRIVRGAFERPRRFFREARALVRRSVRRAGRAQQRARSGFPRFRCAACPEQRSSGRFVRRAHPVVEGRAAPFVCFRRPARFVRTPVRRCFAVRRRVAARSGNVRRRQPGRR